MKERQANRYEETKETLPHCSHENNASHQVKTPALETAWQIPSLEYVVSVEAHTCELSNG